MVGPFVVTVEGVDELARSWESAAHFLERGSERAATEAADAAVAEMQANHPYQDRTYELSGSMHAVPAPARAEGDDIVFETEIVIPAEYASFVDKGTSRADPYPFTPQGEKVAETIVTSEELGAVDAFERSCIGG